MKTQRTIKHIVIHCTATPQTTTIASIKDYWKRMKGWGEVPGYHYIIRPCGEIVSLWPEEKASNGVYGHNATSLNVAYIGGVDAKGRPLDNRTLKQKEALFNLIVRLCERYPQAIVVGHRDFKGVMKDCPSFDVTTWLRSFVPNVIVKTLSADKTIHVGAAAAPDENESGSIA